MAENYKHLYEQCKKMLTMYQDELIPWLRKRIKELEQNQVKVRCKDCVNYCGFEHCKNGICDVDSVSKRAVYPDDFCSYGERRDGE